MLSCNRTIRTQIQLTEEQTSRATKLAVARSVSMAEVIHDVIDAAETDAVSEIKKNRALQVIGKFRSGKKDVSRRHDHPFPPVKSVVSSRPNLPEIVLGVGHF